MFLILLRTAFPRKRIKCRNFYGFLKQFVKFYEKKQKSVIPKNAVISTFFMLPCTKICMTLLMSVSVLGRYFKLASFQQFDEERLGRVDSSRIPIIWSETKPFSRHTLYLKNQKFPRYHVFGSPVLDCGKKFSSVSLLLVIFFIKLSCKKNFTKNS